MADHHNEEEEKKSESLMHKISDKIHGHGHDSSSSSSSSSDSEEEKKSSVKAKVNRLFGREKPVHRVLGGGKPADVFLWKDKKVSAGVLGGATFIWILFDVLEYHLLSLVCHGSIIGLVFLFLWSHASTFIKKIPPRIPEIRIPEEPVLSIVSALRIHFNQGFTVLRDIASGKDIKKFLSVIAGLWVLSFLGSCCDFLALLFSATVLLFTVPLFYETYEDQIECYAEKAMVELKKQYAVFDAKVLSKIPRGPLKNKKSD